MSTCICAIETSLTDTEILNTCIIKNGKLTQNKETNKHKSKHTHAWKFHQYARTQTNISEWFQTLDRSLWMTVFNIWTTCHTWVSGWVVCKILQVYIYIYLFSCRIKKEKKKVFWTAEKVSIICISLLFLIYDTWWKGWVKIRYCI